MNLTSSVHKNPKIMQSVTNKFCGRKVFLLIACFVVFDFQIVQAQFINKIKKAIGDAIVIGEGLGWLANTANRTYSEFNKTVTVVKGSSSTDAGNTSGGKVNNPKIKNGKMSDVDWEQVSYFDGQLFPSSIICMSTYKGQLTPIIEAISRPLGFRLFSKTSNLAIKWEIECVDKRFFDKVSDTYIYPQANSEVSLNPVIPWNYEALVKHTSTEPLNVYFRLFDDKGNKIEKLVTLSLRSINDCIFYYKDLNLQFMYATYVQEEHSAIDGILRDALNTKMIGGWIGYQDSAKQVDLQIASIWRVLHDKGFVYSSITTTTGDNGNVHSQVVRTFDNSLKTNQANCVDGTVVFASILRKIGISPIMVLVPGHCFLGYYTDKTKMKIRFLETTMLSNDGYLSKAKTDKEKLEAYINEFLDARTEGDAEFNKWKKAQDERKKADPKSDDLINLVDVDDYRTIIKPIPVYN